MSTSEDDQGSCSRRFDDDEKPLKKARYVWEVKGKYHLKDKHKQKAGNSKIKEEEDRAGSNSDVNKCCIDAFLAKTERIMDSDDEDHRNIDQAISNEIPVTLVSLSPKNEEYYLQKWQARQIARGFVDNTINRVLETLVNPPINADDLLENLVNDGQVEDEGILMAIQSHGLQSTDNSAPIISLNQVVNIEEFAMDNFENQQAELNSQEADSVMEMEDPMDFLNAAVSVAIQKKGLSSCSF